MFHSRRMCTSLSIALLSVSTLFADTLTVTFSAAGAESVLDSVRIEYVGLDTSFGMLGTDTLYLLTTQGTVSSDAMPAGLERVKSIWRHEFDAAGRLRAGNYGDDRHSSELWSRQEARAPFFRAAQKTSSVNSQTSHFLVYGPEDSLTFTGWAAGLTAEIAAVIEDDQHIVFSFTPDPSTMSVGQPYGGGWIGAFFRSGDPGYVPGEAHGLIVDTVDLGVYHWGCSTKVIGETTIGIGEGKANTEAIVAKCSDPQAAAYRCSILERGGFSDWFLPSLYELERIYANRDSLGMGQSLYYWSSSEIHSNVLYAWYKNFQTGQNSQEHRQRYKLPVRAVRYF